MFNFQAYSGHLDALNILTCYINNLDMKDDQGKPSVHSVLLALFLSTPSKRQEKCHELVVMDYSMEKCMMTDLYE